MASQMSSATVEKIALDVHNNESEKKKEIVLRANGHRLTFEGYLAAYNVVSARRGKDDDPEDARVNKGDDGDEKGSNEDDDDEDDSSSAGVNVVAWKRIVASQIEPRRFDLRRRVFSVPPRNCTTAEIFRRNAR